MTSPASGVSIGQDALVDLELLDEREAHPVGAERRLDVERRTVEEDAAGAGGRIELVELPVLDPSRPVRDDDPARQARDRHPAVAAARRRQRCDGPVETDPDELHRLVVTRALDANRDDLAGTRPREWAAKPRVRRQLPRHGPARVDMPEGAAAEEGDPRRTPRRSSRRQALRRRSRRRQIHDSQGSALREGDAPPVGRPRRGRGEMEGPQRPAVASRDHEVVRRRAAGDRLA